MKLACALFAAVFSLIPSPSLAFRLAPQSSAPRSGKVAHGLVVQLFDVNGAVIQKARVTITNQETKTHASTLTDGDGRVQMPNLRAGHYEVEVRARGFKMITKHDVVVPASGPMRLQMQVEESDRGGLDMSPTKFDPAAATVPQKLTPPLPPKQD